MFQSSSLSSFNAKLGLWKNPVSTCQPEGVTHRFLLKLRCFSDLIPESMPTKSCKPSSSILLPLTSSFTKSKLESCRATKNDTHPCEMILSESLSFCDTSISIPTFSNCSYVSINLQEQMYLRCQSDYRSNSASLAEFPSLLMN